MQLAKLLLATTVAVVLLADCAFGIKGGCGKYVEFRQDENVERWAQDNYATVLNKLLPSGEVIPKKFPDNVKWMATVRILAPFEKPEYQFAMQRMYDGKVTVSVIKARGVSIRSQLQTLKSKYPSASLARISASVSLDHRTITQSDKSQLSQLAAEFEAINMSPVLPDELRVDDTGYEFWSQSLWGNRMSVTLSGPGANTKRQPHPLLQWAEAVRSFVESVPRAN